jgi:hypothetical protein
MQREGTAQVRLCFICELYTLIFFSISLALPNGFFIEGRFCVCRVTRAIRRRLLTAETAGFKCFQGE